MLELSVSHIIFAIVNFGLLVFLLGKFLFRPIMRMLDERRTSIDEALMRADKAREEVAGTEVELRQRIAEARAEASTILADAKKRGEETRLTIVAQAESEALSLVASAKAEIEQEKEDALADLKAQIADLALSATEKLLTSGLTDQQQHMLLDRYAKEVSHLQ